MSILRLQDTGEDETPCDETFEGTLKLPASREVYEALLPEGVPMEFNGSEIHVRFGSGSLKGLKVALNSWLRLYEALRGVEKEGR